MKKLLMAIVAMAMLAVGCGGEIPENGKWGEPIPPGVSYIDAGNQCYVNDLNLLQIYRDCEELCAEMWTYPLEYATDRINLYNAIYEQRTGDRCGDWDMCWETEYEMIYMLFYPENGILIEEWMSKYYHC